MSRPSASVLSTAIVLPDIDVTISPGRWALPSGMAPPAPSREQVETMLKNKKYDTYEERYIRELRRNAFIDYKDPHYAAQ